MSEPLNEQLSAFIDGELPSEESGLFVRQIPRDAQLRATASRYYLIGQAVRAELPSVRRGFAARVLAAVAQEPGASGAAAAVSAMARELPRSRWFGLWKPAAGIAVAAGVAMVAILFFQQRQGERAPPEVIAYIVPNGTPYNVHLRSDTAAEPTQVVSGTSGEPRSYTVPPLAPATESPLGAARLASYVLAHSEYSSLPGRRNVVSDAAVQDIEATQVEAAPAEAPKP
jgi:negative regulator of sigma E activity